VGVERGGWRWVDVVLDVDASLLEIHSENKQQATASYKGGYGSDPMS